ncbi:hypothetical protein MLD38_011079 [Melastoma candidum]|uniref:Uncharacterized protein n=1 Tax=Melastoma candidum TaxID=119954 RepID=A0ACB9R1X7_9MYRT|nr:hypothetical protein MLD38_011079 [Melastoma candidum]
MSGNGRGGRVSRWRSHEILSIFVTVHPHETSPLLHSSGCFFFILSAYFVVLPLRDEGAISLGLSNLPSLFVGSLVLTLIVAPLSTLVFSSSTISKAKGLVLIHRFFGLSLVVFFALWHFSSPGLSPLKMKGSTYASSTDDGDQGIDLHHALSPDPATGQDHGLFYMLVRMALYLWIALLNLITISSTWARVIDIMDSESGSRLFGFIGAGATLGQLFGSLLATVMAWLGPLLLLFAALLLELAAQSSKGICKELSNHPEELSPLKKDGPDPDHENDNKGKDVPPRVSSPSSSNSDQTPQIWAILDGLRLIFSSTYLLSVALFLWLGAVVSSFFYFQKVTVIAMAVTSSVDRRKLFAEINSFIAIFILTGQVTLTGRILAVAGVTLAICAAPFVSLFNLVAVALWPSWIAVAISETLRKVVTYVVTRPGRELLFTVVSQEEKYKAKVCIDVIVQRLGDATAAGLFKLLFGYLNGRISTVSLYALPVCILWIMTAVHLGARQAQLIFVE